jgi:hypothetical protein
MTCVSTVTQIGRSIVMAGALAALTLTTVPTAAHAGGPGVGAAIGLGILGGCDRRCSNRLPAAVLCPAAV